MRAKWYQGPYMQLQQMLGCPYMSVFLRTVSHVCRRKRGEQRSRPSLLDIASVQVDVECLLSKCQCFYVTFMCLQMPWGSFRVFLFVWLRPSWSEARSRTVRLLQTEGQIWEECWNPKCVGICGFEPQPYDRLIGREPRNWPMFVL